MKKFLTSIAVSVACLLASAVHAAVPTGNLQSFNTRPLAADWSTLSVPGSGGGIATSAAMDAAVVTNAVAIITNRVVETGSATPGGNALALWSSASQHLITRPTGNAYTILMATIQNTTGSAINSAIPVSYDFGLPSALAGEDAELAGLRAYYSFTGDPNSWTHLPELTSATPTPVAGAVSANINFGNWPAGGTLYIIWVDDNGGPGGDGSFSIDNFIIGSAPPPPSITQQPVGATNLVGRTVSLTVVANGSGLTYQWQKVGVGPIDTTANPSAATATLVITNAQLTDTGDYFVSISSPFGGVASSTARIQINPDTFAPVFLSARLGANNATIIVAVDEPLCDADGCVAPGFGTKVTGSEFSWNIVNPNNPLEVVGVNAVALENGTNLIFTPGAALVAGEIYRVIHEGAAGQIGDLFQNLVPANTFIETLPTVAFQQGVNSYAGTQDTYVQSNVPDQIEGTNPVLETDSSNPAGGISQGLIRFDGIFGSNPGQIPASATIISATLTFNQTDPGSPAGFHRMLADWNQVSATWNVLGGGVANDGVEAVVAADATSPTSAPNGALSLDVTASVQAWADGAPNYGWFINPTGTDGWRLNTSESLTAPPTLTVIYRVNPCNTPPSISTQPPATLSVNEGSGFSITVGVSACQPTFQWTKDGVDIPGANSTTLSVASAVAGAGGSAGSYRLRITNPNGTVTSSATVVTVVADTTRPVLTRAIGPNNTSVVLTFSKPLSTASAQTLSRYTISGGVTVTGAVLSNGANNATVTLTTSARPAGNQTLTITGVTDNRAGANVIDPNPTTVALTTVQVIDGWNSTWSYNTNNLDGSPDWKTTGGADWQTGNALFGTETSAGVVALFPTPIATPLPPNTNTPPDMITYYFRKQVTLPALPAGMSYALNHIIDDGAVFYLDGVEIGRLNMTNTTPIVYSTRAATAGEAVLLSLPFTATPGNHTLAVEVHQGGATTSSDVLFGAQIIAIPTAAPSLSIARVGGTNVVSWTADSSWELHGSPVVTGPYNAVAGTGFRNFRVPPAANTNNNFFRLNYRPQP